jgi:hypothetical protein
VGRFHSQPQNLATVHSVDESKFRRYDEGWSPAKIKTLDAGLRLHDE